MNKPLWIATSNNGKKTEFKKLLKNFDIKTIDDLPDSIEIIEDGQDFDQNALIKAKTLAMITKQNAIGDDSGIMIEGLNNFPGIYSKRWAYPIVDEKQICQKLIDKMQKEIKDNNWKAKMVTSIAFYNFENQTSKIFTKFVNGTISKEIKLGEGFGYDFIFIPNGFDKTYSQLGNDEKIKSSSRFLALEELKKYLINIDKEKDD